MSEIESGMGCRMFSFFSGCYGWNIEMLLFDIGTLDDSTKGVTRPLRFH